MAHREIGIATARIYELTEDPYYFEAKCYFAANIMFDETSTLMFYNLPFIYLGESLEEARKTWERVKENFKKAGIYEKKRVAIIFEKGDVIAIGSAGRDCWIDVSDEFKVKTFKKLNIDITSLKVY